MDFKQHMSLMEKAGAGNLVGMASAKLGDVISSCLKPSGGKLLVITDTGENNHLSAGILGAGYYLASKSIGVETLFVSQKPRTSMDKADTEIEKTVEELGEGDMVILAVSNKLGRMSRATKSFRKFATDLRLKFISATSLGNVNDSDFDTLLDSISIDYARLGREQSITKGLLDKAQEIHVKSGNGTDVWIKLKKNSTISNDGRYAEPGTGGNVPAGEVYLPPAAGKSEGTIVVDGSSRNEFGTWVVKKPFSMIVENGSVVSIEGSKEAKLLEASLLLAEERATYPERVRNLAELGIGFNPRAGIIGSMIVDEKTSGTCHFALGSNYWFGGDNRTIVHFDQVVRNPRIEIDEDVMDTGSG